MRKRILDQLARDNNPVFGGAMMPLDEMETLVVPTTIKPIDTLKSNFDFAARFFAEAIARRNNIAIEKVTPEYVERTQKERSIEDAKTFSEQHSNKKHFTFF